MNSNRQKPCGGFPYSIVITQDDVLQRTPNLPAWSLLKHLVEPRRPDLLRSPEFSQPMVTALQRVLMAIFEDWGISPKAMDGHSFGGLAAPTIYPKKMD